MPILTRKYPFEEKGRAVKDSLIYCVIVFLILYFLQPFGFSGYQGSKLLVSLLFGGVTFGCCLLYGLCVSAPLHKRIKPWKIWHQVLQGLGLTLFIGLSNFLLFSLVFHYPIQLNLCLLFLYWTLLISLIIASLSTALSYSRFLRRQLNTLLDKTTEEQEGVTVTIHDTRVRGNDIGLPINDLLCIEAQKNNVAVFYLKDGKLVREEIQTTLAAVLEDLGGYANVFQCHRSFVVNLNSITSAKGNSNGYTLELGGGVVTVPVSRSYVPKLKSFIA